MGESIRILFLAADPSDQARTRLTGEFQMIRDELNKGKLADRFDLDAVFSAKIPDLTGGALNFRPHILHFAGHGSVDGELVFEDPATRSKRVKPADLEGIFKSFAGRIHCVVLNACFSQQQASMIAQHVPAVVGMKGVVTDQAAICFARGFYQSLGAGENVPTAFEIACALLRAEGFAGQGEPVLEEALAGYRVGPALPANRGPSKGRDQKGRAKPASARRRSAPNRFSPKVVVALILATLFVLSLAVAAVAWLPELRRGGLNRELEVTPIAEAGAHARILGAALQADGRLELRGEVERASAPAVDLVEVTFNGHTESSVLGTDQTTWSVVLPIDRPKPGGRLRLEVVVLDRERNVLDRIPVTVRFQSSAAASP